MHFRAVLGSGGESYLEYHSNYLSQAFAERFGGECVQLFAPALFSKQTVLADFLKETTICKVISLYHNLDILVMGIGGMASNQSTVLHTGYVDHKTLEDFNCRGAVGDIILRYFDAEGNAEPFADFNKRVVGINLNLNTLPALPMNAHGAAEEFIAKLNDAVESLQNNSAVWLSRKDLPHEIWRDAVGYCIGQEKL